MSEAGKGTGLGEDATSFATRWSWLRSDLHLTRDALGTRLWPDWGQAGRARFLELLQAEDRALETLPESPPATPLAGRRLLARRLLKREIRLLDHPLDREDLAEFIAAAVGPAALIADPGLARERLMRLPELLDPLRQGGRLILAGDGTGSRIASRRLRALARHLEQRLPRLLPDETGSAASSLATLAEELDCLPDLGGAVANPVDLHDDESLGLGLQPLLERVELELKRLGRNLERRAATLHARYHAAGVVDTQDPLAFVLEQFALDQPRPEHWAWIHQRSLDGISSFLARLGLDCGAPLSVQIEPGLALGWPEPACGSMPLAHSPGMRLSDLSTLDEAALAAHLEDRCNPLLPVLVAREGLPGRAWGLARQQSMAETDPAQGVMAALLRPADLDLWARWAGEWLASAGWMQGELRLRLMLKREQYRELLMARADLERRLGIREDAEIRRRWQREATLPPAIADAAWRVLLKQPGRMALAAALHFEFRDAARRWQRRAGAAGVGGAASADWFHIVAETAPLPLDWLRAHLTSQPARGSSWAVLPPALVQPAAERGENLLSEMEERLAALGRIRQEDLEAGREFDLALSISQESPPA